ncbi:hypothetical protein SERLA73DRAFT_76391 [Serpula lacrymans var. lacrymans S7.3]|uniref:Retrotransposon gag domain-containing protein n=1 Tax=Serpula lacrymans var. lacrymans (strain S7.3) TaxID=936435 RepID=F8Q5F9_SERL3|nr:hypothetical protein SERLA73DRAFT_76391 [Serpula lacrymans var. lacrymans S7.3]
MSDEPNHGSKAILASPPFEFSGKKETYVDWKNALANYFFAYPKSFETNSSKVLFALSRISSDKANNACHTWKANFNNSTAVQGDLLVPRNWGTISEFIKELDTEFLDPHLKLKAEIALHNYEQRDMTVDAYFGGLESKLMEAGLPPGAEESYPFIQSILRQNLSQFLRDRISQQEHLPTTYLEWKTAARKWEQQNEELNLERRRERDHHNKNPSTSSTDHITNRIVTTLSRHIINKQYCVQRRKDHIIFNNDRITQHRGRLPRMQSILTLTQ